MRNNLILKILAGMAAGVVLALLLPGARAIGLLGTVFVGALKAMAPLLVFLLVCSSVASQAVAVGFIIGVVQDSFETALNSSADVFFTATAELREKIRR